MDFKKTLIVNEFYLYNQLNLFYKINGSGEEVNKKYFRTFFIFNKES
jgi:hypothetical protein